MNCKSKNSSTTKPSTVGGSFRPRFAKIRGILGDLIPQGYQRITPRKGGTVVPAKPPTLKSTLTQFKDAILHNG